ncbi:MAG: methyltransferase domain-containing protein, partial [Clostridium sp.]|nr:methyltransferase domain-containing protein [Clostridium sp.]
MTESGWDKLLGIKTSGRDDSHSDQYRYPYEPTPYSVLERLAASGYIGKQNIFLDYGCGKGRVSFFISYQCRCKTIGIEYDDRIYEAAVRNKENAVSGNRVELLHARAETYGVMDVDRVFFFNPFSVEILKSVMGRIRESWYGNQRQIFLFFYYINDDYMGYLM